MRLIHLLIVNIFSIVIIPALLLCALAVPYFAVRLLFAAAQRVAIFEEVLVQYVYNEPSQEYF